jgi:hypothetical protein
MVAITADNAQEVSSVVLQSVDATFQLGSATGGQVTPASAAPTAGASALRHVLPRLSRARSHGLDVQPLAAFGPETLDCDVSGSVTLSGNLADPETLSAGDRITASFNDCRDEEPFLLDGQLEIVVRTVQGDFLTDAYLLTLDLTLTNLNVTDGTENFTGDGDVTLTLDSLDFPVTLSRLAGTLLELGSGQDVYTLTDFNHSLQDDATNVPEEFTAEAFGSVASDLLGGMVDYETVTPVLASGDDDPGTGEILVTGADGTTVNIVIVDSANVSLEIDVDGDGTPDETQDTDWSTLNGGS